MAFHHSAPAINLDKYMKTWYVVAGRTTPLEKGHHNATETYRWNQDKTRIDIVYHARKDSFSGKIRTVKQKGWILDPKTRSHWKIRAHYIPIPFDYLVLAVAPDYSWVAVGVPNEKYLWIMSETPGMDESVLAAAMSEVKRTGYPVQDIELKPQQAEKLRSGFDAMGLTRKSVPVKKRIHRIS